MTDTDQTVLMLTCSMKRDLPLFEILAASVDRWVDPRIPHKVVVPRRDMAAFTRFAGPRREILAQEDMLPLPILRLPPAPAILARRKAALRRPIYLTRRLKPMRGWMLQQILKIEIARRAAETAILHVDSDVAFFRALAPEDVFENGCPRFFEAHSAPGAGLHRDWTEVGARLLGIPVPGDFTGHYVENCVVWNTATLRAMLNRIETAHGRPFHALILAEPTVSEYQLYGLFAHSFPDRTRHHAEPVSFCNSIWPEDRDMLDDIEAIAARVVPKHKAFAVQSTDPITPETRARFLATLTDRFAHS